VEGKKGNSCTKIEQQNPKSHSCTTRNKAEEQVRLLVKSNVFDILTERLMVVSFVNHLC